MIIEPRLWPTISYSAFYETVTFIAMFDSILRRKDIWSFWVDPETAASVRYHWCLFVFLLLCLTRSNVRRKEFVWIILPGHKSGQKLEVETTDEICCCFTLSSSLLCFLYSPDHLPRGGPPMVGWVLPYQLSVEAVPHRHGNRLT